MDDFYGATYSYYHVTAERALVFLLLGPCTCGMTWLALVVDLMTKYHRRKTYDELMARDAIREDVERLKEEWRERPYQVRDDEEAPDWE